MAEKEIRPFGMRDKIGYAFGDMGCNFSFQLVSSYMYLFYTQCIGLSAANWAWIIVVSKVWDAVNDVLIGSMVDRKRIGSKSKFMPWISIGSVGFVAFSIMIFTPVGSFSDIGKILWCLISYCLWSVAYTMINVPYGSLHSVITDDPKQRTTLSTFRSIGAALPAILIMLLPRLVYEDNVLSANRLFVVSVVFSVAAFFAFFALRKMVTERVVREDKVEKVSYLSTIKSFFTNRAMVGITIATVAVVIFYNSSMSVNNLVFQFYFNDAGKATLAMIASYIPLVAFMPFASNIAAKIGKKKLLSLSGLVSVIAGVLMLVVPITPDTKGIIIYVIGLMFVNTGCCVFQIIVWAIVADCIEDSYRKKGVREEGSLYALYSFFRKLSQGIGSAVVALALSAVGYVETASVQTAQASENIKNLYIVLLIIGLAIMTLSMKFIYNIGLKEEREFNKTAEN
ncbi:MAG: glycoside-pentoside-hexuronide (GPH):cation symporter [Clostridiales bacterium]|nr:glycoside-pentoside-hexuronide (GPH):cation symporter [Clostridiales bacterium]